MILGPEKIVELMSGRASGTTDELVLTRNSIARGLGVRPDSPAFRELIRSMTAAGYLERFPRDGAMVYRLGRSLDAPSTRRRTDPPAGPSPDGEQHVPEQRRPHGRRPAGLQRAAEEAQDRTRRLHNAWVREQEEAARARAVMHGMLPGIDEFTACGDLIVNLPTGDTIATSPHRPSCQPCIFEIGQYATDTERRDRAAGDVERGTVVHLLSAYPSADPVCGIARSPLPDGHLVTLSAAAATCPGCVSASPERSAYAQGRHDQATGTVDTTRTADRNYVQGLADGRAAQLEHDLAALPDVANRCTYAGGFTTPHVFEYRPEVVASSRADNGGYDEWERCEKPRTDVVHLGEPEADAAWLAELFEFELCHDCGQDANMHRVGVVNGNRFAQCLDTDGNPPPSSDAMTSTPTDRPTEDVVPQRGRRPRMSYLPWRRSQLVNIGATDRDKHFWQCPRPRCQVWAGPYPDPLAAKHDGFQHVYTVHADWYYGRTPVAEQSPTDASSGTTESATGRISATGPAELDTINMHTHAFREPIHDGDQAGYVAYQAGRRDYATQRVDLDRYERDTDYAQGVRDCFIAERLAEWRKTQQAGGWTPPEPQWTRATWADRPASAADDAEEAWRHRVERIDHWRRAGRLNDAEATALLAPMAPEGVIAEEEAFRRHGTAGRFDPAYVDAVEQLSLDAEAPDGTCRYCGESLGIGHQIETGPDGSPRMVHPPWNTDEGTGTYYEAQGAADVLNLVPGDPVVTGGRVGTFEYLDESGETAFVTFTGTTEPEQVPARRLRVHAPTA